MKKGVLKKVLKSVVQSPIVRGLVKSVPFGNMVYEVGENVVGEVTNEISLQEKGKEGKPHNWVSIAVQFAALGVIVYAFVTKQLSVQDVLDLLGFKE